MVVQPCIAQSITRWSRELTTNFVYHMKAEVLLYPLVCIFLPQLVTKLKYSNVNATYFSTFAWDCALGLAQRHWDSMS